MRLNMNFYIFFKDVKQVRLFSSLVRSYIGDPTLPSLTTSLQENKSLDVAIYLADRSLNHGLWTLGPQVIKPRLLDYRKRI